MKKVYGKPREGAMRGAARCMLVCAIALSVAAMPGANAKAADLMLTEETSVPTHGYAWLVAGLSLVAFGIAYNDYQEDEYNTAKAKKAYGNYVAVTVSPTCPLPCAQAAALLYRQQTQQYIDRAQAYESTANAALIIGSVLALTALAIFRSDGPDTTPILLSDRGMQLTFRF